VIPKECKRLAEVDFPIAAVSAHSAREKSIRHGHPSTLHLWWARRPLAACRAMLMALLLPDPMDEHCPKTFKDEARRILLAFAGGKTGWEKTLKTDKGLRQALLHEFIADFANWDNAANPAYLKTARALVKAAHGDETPLVVDPFAGGGSIPLEALRIGCDAFASDLNPVACLITKVLLEDIPRYGPKLSEELRRVGAEIKAQAEKKLAEFYPPDPPDEDGIVARPIAYLWARTVRCEQPNCGCEIPLVRSFWLAKKRNRKRAIRYKVLRPKDTPPYLEYEVFEPKSDGEVAAGSVTRAKATCPACGKALGPDRVCSQIAQQRGGADPQFNGRGQRISGAKLLAVALLRPNGSGRQYRCASDGDYQPILRAQRHLERRSNVPPRDGRICPIPNEPLPPSGTLGFRVQRYGMAEWGQLFNSRQRLSLSLLAEAVAGLPHGSTRDALALAVSKLSELACSLCAWEPVAECPRHVFGRQTLQITWDFAEGVLTSQSSGSFETCFNNTAHGVESVGPVVASTSPQVADACHHPLPDESASVWFTDPPYYDAVPYSDLSDFFYVWLRRCVPDAQCFKNTLEPGNPLSPKQAEIVQDESKRLGDGRRKDRAFFEERMGAAFTEGHRVLTGNGIGAVVFAHKTTEGWEAMLSGMIKGKWTITGSWPIATEAANRLRARDSAALATSVHLVCRRREEDAGIGDWGDIVRELPRRITDWMELLSQEGVHGADLVFACIGPALELYSRYERVEDAAGNVIPLGGDPEATEPHQRGFLSYVWEVAGRAALNQVLGSAEAKAKNGAAGALEEDARLTALFLWTLQATDAKAARKAEDQSEAEEKDAGEEDEEDAAGEDTGATGSKKKGLTLIYDVARRFAQPLGIHLDIWEGRIIETAKGVVRLLPVSERAKQLFGEQGASAVVRKFEATKKPDPQVMFDFMAERRAAVPEVRSGRRSSAASAEGLRTRKEATTLDRVHAAMLLQASGAPNALRALLAAEIQRGPDFLRLANALSALYPRDSEEKRLLDAMLLAVPR
jgi:putative DNA methylase